MSYIKKPAEIALITEGGKLMGEILEKLVHMVKPGISTGELDVAAEEMIRAAGGCPAFKGYQPRGMPVAFSGTICASINHELVHGIPSKKRILADGDILTIDIGMEWPTKNQNANSKNKKSRFGGFFTDTAITVAVGEIPEKTKKLLTVTQQALEIGIAQCQSGKTIADIGKAIEAFIKPYGYGIVRDLVGHGVGHAVHEEPRVPNYYERNLEVWEIRPGVVIAIEPMITLGSHEVRTERDHWTVATADKSLCAHFEHTVVITENGPVVVTRRHGELVRKPLNVNRKL